MSATGPATIDDLRRVPKDGRVYELVDGAIIVTPAGMRHSSVAARITAVLANFVFPRAVGEVYTADVGIELPNGNVRSPDASFVRTEKLPGGRSPVDYGALVPDLVVEVLSPSDSAAAMMKKVREYVECGVPLVWVVDPERRTVAAHRSIDVVTEYAGNDLAHRRARAARILLPHLRVFSTLMREGWDKDQGPRTKDQGRIARF